MSSEQYPMERKVKGNKSGIWTPEEDELLAEWQSQLGNKWAEIAEQIPNKNGQQCAQRWRHRVNPNIRRDKWTADEDILLGQLVDVHGSSWAIISRAMPGRTDQQCMGRWRRHLDPTIRREGWSLAEDTQLFMLAEEHSNAWATVARDLTGRTSQQCRTRWHHLSSNPAAVEKSRQAIIAMRAAQEQRPGTKRGRGRPSKATAAAAAANAAAAAAAAWRSGTTPPKKKSMKLKVHRGDVNGDAGGDALTAAGRRPGRPSCQKGASPSSSAHYYHHEDDDEEHEENEANDDDVDEDDDEGMMLDGWTYASYHDHPPIGTADADAVQSAEEEEESPVRQRPVRQGFIGTASTAAAAAAAIGAGSYLHAGNGNANGNGTAAAPVPPTFDEAYHDNDQYPRIHRAPYKTAEEEEELKGGGGGGSIGGDESGDDGEYVPGRRKGKRNGQNKKRPQTVKLSTTVPNRGGDVVRGTRVAATTTARAKTTATTAALQRQRQKRLRQLQQEQEQMRLAASLYHRTAAANASHANASRERGVPLEAAEVGGGEIEPKEEEEDDEEDGEMRRPGGVYRQEKPSHASYHASLAAQQHTQQQQQQEQQQNELLRVPKNSAKITTTATRVLPQPAAAAAAAATQNTHHHQQHHHHHHSINEYDDPPLLLASSSAAHDERRMSIGNVPLSPALFSPALTPPWSRRKRMDTARHAAFGPSIPPPSSTTHHNNNTTATGNGINAPSTAAINGAGHFSSPQNSPAPHSTPPYHARTTTTTGYYGTSRGLPSSERRGGGGGGGGDDYYERAAIPSPAILDLLQSPQRTTADHHRLNGDRNATGGGGGGGAHKMHGSELELGGNMNMMDDGNFASSPPLPQFRGLVTPEWARAAAAASAAAEDAAEARRLSIASVARRLDVDCVAGDGSGVNGGVNGGVRGVKRAHHGADADDFNQHHHHHQRRESLLSADGNNHHLVHGGNYTTVNTTTSGNSPKRAKTGHHHHHHQQRPAHCTTAAAAVATEMNLYTSPPGSNSMSLSLSLSAGGIPAVSQGVVVMSPGAEATPTAADAKRRGGGNNNNNNHNHNHTTTTSPYFFHPASVTNLLVPEPPSSHGRTFLAATLQRTVGSGLMPTPIVDLFAAAASVVPMDTHASTNTAAAAAAVHPGLTHQGATTFAPHPHQQRDDVTAAMLQNQLQREQHTLTSRKDGSTTAVNAHNLSKKAAAGASMVPPPRKLLNSTDVRMKLRELLESV